MKAPKAPAFLLYAGDFLSSPDVQAMDTREVGAYCLLLFNAWQGDMPGHLPNNEERLRRLTKMSAAEWAVSRELLLSKFPEAENGLTRYNPRLIVEAQKQAANRAKKSANGKRGGRPSSKKPLLSTDSAPASEMPAEKQIESEKKQMLSVEKQMLSESKANGKQTESLSISISLSSDDDSAREASSSIDLPAQAPEQPERVAGRPAVGGDPRVRELALASSDPSEEQAWHEGPLTKPAAFRAICERLPHGQGIDCEHYRKLALIAAEDGQVSRTIAQWVSWIGKFLTNQLKSGPLLKPTDGDAARTGVHAPQYARGYVHQVKPELQAQREAEEAARIDARIQANYARHAAQAWPTTPAAA